MARFARIGAACIAHAILIQTSVPAQQPTAPKRRGPGAAMNDAFRRGQAPQAGQQPLSEEFDPTGGPPYRTPDGRYVTPDPNSPDGWSPAQRLYPDYSQFRSNDAFRNRALGSRDEMRSDQQYQGYYVVPQDVYIGGDALGDAYSQGRYDARHDYLWHLASQRAGRLLNQYAQIFDDGIEAFYEGRYDRAAINLLGAADKNQASAAARLHAGHALFALGRYDDAIRHIARAFELSPGLAHKTYDIRDEYGDIQDFQAHYAALERFVAGNAGSVGGQAMLGYVTFFSGNPGGAYMPLARAARLDPRSYFIPKLLDLARMTQSASVQPKPYVHAPNARQITPQPSVAPLPLNQSGRSSTLQRFATPSRRPVAPVVPSPADRAIPRSADQEEDPPSRIRRV